MPSPTSTKGASPASAIAPLGDLNDDAFADLAVGAPGIPGAIGRVFVHLGGGGGGLPRGMTTHVQSIALRFVHPFAGLLPSGVGVEVKVRSAEGRARLRVEIEAALLHEAFTGVASTTSGPIDSENPNAGTGSVVSPSLPVTGLQPGTAYRLRTRTTSRSPFFPRSRWITPEAHTSGDHDIWTAGSVVAVPDAPGSRGPARLSGIAPSPARGAEPSRVSFALRAAARVTVDVLDLRGARVRRLLDAAIPAGSGGCAWDGRDAAGRAAPAGVYFVRLVAGDTVDQGRLVRLR